jgi:antitoxin component YwqK of YwqJK toxin-antitoxin module
MNVSAPTTTYYPNGNKESEFTPNGLGGQAGQYTYYDQNGKKLLSENRSVNGHVGFECDYRPDGSIGSTTVTPPHGAPRTMMYAQTASK